MTETPTPPDAPKATEQEAEKTHYLVPTSGKQLIKHTFDPLRMLMRSSKEEQIKANLEWYAKHLLASGIAGVKNVSQGVIIASELGKSGKLLNNFRSRYHIIGGNVVKSSEAMLADFKASGGKWRYLSMTSVLASIELQVGRDKQVFSMSWEEAQEEDFIYTSAANDGKVKKKLPSGEINPAALKDNWKTPRRRRCMMMWRCISEGIGFMAPDISAGDLTAEERDVMFSDLTAYEEHGDIIVSDDPVEDPVAEEPPFEDAEFEVKNQASADELPASQQPSGPTEALQPQPVHAQAASQASTAVEYRDHPTPVPPPSEADIEARRQVLASRRSSNILRCHEIYNILKPDPAKWAAALAAYRVENVRSMDDEQLEHFRDRLEKKIEQTAVAAGKDEVSQFLQKQLEKKV